MKAEEKNFRKQLLNYNFLKQHHEITKLREMDGICFYQFLVKKGFRKEAKKCLKNGVDGNQFIKLMTEERIPPSLKFKNDQISNLKALYEFIYRIRKLIAHDFIEQEIPTHNI